VPINIDDGNILTLDECLSNGTIVHMTSFNLSEHLSLRNTSSTTSQNKDSSQGDTQDTTDSESQDQNSDTSSTGVNPDSASSNNQETEDKDKIHPAILITVALVFLVLIGLAVFVLPGIINKKNNPTPPAPTQNNAKMPSKGPPRRPLARRMPPRR